VLGCPLLDTLTLVGGLEGSKSSLNDFECERRRFVAVGAANWGFPANWPNMGSDATDGQVDQTIRNTRKSRLRASLAGVKAHRTQASLRAGWNLSAKLDTVGDGYGVYDRE